jgi:hypothetical protein
MRTKKGNGGQNASGKLHGGEVAQGEKPKSKTRLFWEKYPGGIGGEIVDMRAVLR